MSSRPLGGQDGERDELSSGGTQQICLPSILFHTTDNSMKNSLCQCLSRILCLSLYPLEVNANVSHLAWYKPRSSLNHSAEAEKESRFKETNLVGRTPCVLNNRNPPRSSHPKTRGITTPTTICYGLCLCLCV